MNLTFAPSSDAHPHRLLTEQPGAELFEMLCHAFGLEFSFPSCRVRLEDLEAQRSRKGEHSTEPGAWRLRAV